MSSTVVLISGANRGLGKGLLERYLARPNHIIVAANRDLEHATSQELASLAQGAGSRLIVVKVDAGTDSDALEAVEELKKQGVDHLDLVIANAGVSYAFGKVSDIKIAEIKGHFEPNVYGVVRLYQATVPLLRESANATWVTIGSTAGSIEVGLPVNLHLR
jgi:NAD(P)-dependent dehydrogenase (short-subunit alcohol dehydrogenase family)